MTVAVMMGVSGSGKTTIALGVAQRLGWAMLEGDSFHPPANVAKMAAGHALTDDDRWPWLHAIAEAIDARRAAGQSAIVTCSALKRAYRDILVGNRPDVVLVYLRGSKELIGQRIGQRRGHFMPAALLDSQFATLEEPAPDEHAKIVSIDADPATIIEDALRQIQDAAPRGSPSGSPSGSQMGSQEGQPGATEAPRMPPGAP